MTSMLRSLAYLCALLSAAVVPLAPALADDEPMLLVRSTTVELFARVRAERDQLR